MNNTSISVAHDEQSQQHLVQAGREIESRSTDDKWDLGWSDARLEYRFFVL
jgi:hypothetical protein